MNSDSSNNSPRTRHRHRHRHRSRVLSLLVLALLLAGLSALWLYQQPPNPAVQEFDGRKAADWAEQVHFRSGNESEQAKAYVETNLPTLEPGLAKTISPNSFLITKAVEKVEEGLPRPFQVWIDGLTAKEAPYRARVAAAQTLGELGTNMSGKTVHALRQAVGDPEISYYSALALARAGPRAAPILQDKTRSKEPKVRVAALWALGTMRLPQEELNPYLLDGFADPNPTVFRTAQQLLRGTQFRGLPLVAELLQHPEEAVQARALTFIEDAGAISFLVAPQLLDLIQDPSQPLPIRVQAAAVFQKMGQIGRRFIPDLRTLLAPSLPESLRQEISTAIEQLESTPLPQPPDPSPPAPIPPSN